MNAQMKTLITKYVNARIALSNRGAQPPDEWIALERAVERAWNNLERYVDSRG